MAESGSNTEDLKEGVLYEYHRLEEKEKSTISSWWTALHIILLGLCTVVSFLAFIFLSDVIIFFESNCIFYARAIVFKNETETTTSSNETVKTFKGTMMSARKGLSVDFLNSAFSRSSKCFMPYFFPVLSIIFSITWLALFIMVRGLKHPWRIVIPALVFALAFSIFCYVFQAQYTQGAFHFKDMIVNASITANMTENLEVRELLNFVDVYVYSMSLNTIFWTLTACLLVFRLISAADFNYVKVQVELIKLNPEDIPLLSKYTGPDSDTILTHTPEVTKRKVPKKHLLSLTKPSKNTAQKPQSKIDGDESDTTSLETLTFSPPSTRVIINPMTVTVDVETGKKETIPTRDFKSTLPEPIPSTSYDSNPSSISDDRRPLIVDDSPLKRFLVEERNASDSSVSIDTGSGTTVTKDDDQQQEMDAIESTMDLDDVDIKSTLSKDSNDLLK